MSGLLQNFDMFRNRKKGVTTIKGKVVLRKASLLDAKDFSASFGDRLFELMQQKVYFQLVSSDQIDKETRHGKRSHRADLEWKYLLPSLEYVSKDSTHEISFEWAPEMGTPGAVLVTNNHSREFFLKELSIEIPGKGDIRFLCNSWIYPKWMTTFCSNLTAERVFFANNSYLPDETPIGLVDLRNTELVTMKANGTGERKTWDRIYDYDVYNDLGDPDNKKELERKVLGGSQELPYPRRCRTGRPRSKTSPAFECIKRLCLTQSFYIPSDEQFPPDCLSDFRAHFLKAFCKVVIPAILSTVKPEFGSLKEVRRLYSKGISFLTNMTTSLAKEILPGKTIKGILNTDDQAILRFPLPNIISKDDDAWMTEEEFGRQTLSGVNPMVIRCLQSFPPSSSLNAQIYGSQQSAITAEHILKNLDGISVEEAIKSKRLFILDYYDAYMPYVELVNQLPSAKAYATRSIFFLAETGDLKPVAIELCLPPTSVGLGSRCVYTPDNSGEDEGWLWRLAKAHVRSNDSGYHQLVSHWLRTHAVVEPFIIATNRNLSKLHPLHKLLLPHFRNTMEINRSARQSLINAGGIIEQCFTSGRYSMEISSKAYMDWRFNEQGLPADLLKRGMAVPDPTDKENGLSLVIKDYPYAVDGLEIWAALKSWVSEYISLYYKDDHAVQSDKEVQAWWKEIVEVGHGDKKHDETGWYKMKSVEDVIESITTLIWIASAHHAAVNFGQYGYAGFMPNHPSTTRKHIPEKGSPQYSEFLRDREAYFLKTVSNPRTAATTMAVLELLSKHSSDEVYLGQGSASVWTDDSRVETAFQRFRSSLSDIEKNIEMRNHDPSLPNRRGRAEVPYTLLYPGTSITPETGVGLTFRGIPNSVSI
jgi:linoleate 9S-lipoxygenase